MDVSEYKVGDLSSLLGFGDVEAESTLFHREITGRTFEAPLFKTTEQPKKKKKKSKTTLKDDKSELPTSELPKKKKKQSKTNEKSELPTEVPTERSEQPTSELCESADITRDGDGQSTSTSTPEKKTALQTESKNARKKRKRRETLLVEKREAELFDGDEPKKKRKKEEERDSEEEDEKEEKKTKKGAKTPKDPEVEARTVFVGNLPSTIEKKPLRSLFAPFGAIATVRLRGIVSSDPKQSKRAAAITNNLHSKLESRIAYVVFVESAAAQKAAAEVDGTEWQGRHLRVDLCSKAKTHNDKLSVFVGNLPYDVTDEALHRQFQDSCGDVSRVRVVRDRTSGMGKGFGYVEFKSMGAVMAAVKQNEQLMSGGRPLRIKRALHEGGGHPGPKQRKAFQGDPGKRKTKNNKGKFANKKKGKKSYKKDSVKL